MLETCWNCGGEYDRESEEVVFKEYFPRGGLLDGFLRVEPDQEPVGVYKKCPHCLVTIE